MPVYSKEKAESCRYWLDHDCPGELDFIDSYATMTGGPILELAVGAARVAKELARRGHTVYGVEMSPAMVDKAHEVVGRMDAHIRDRIRLVRGDMTRFAFKQKFPLIYIPFNSFWYNLDETGAEACVRCMIDHLAPGGLFLVESEYEQSWQGDVAATFWRPMAEKLGFRFRYQKYARDLHESQVERKSFLIGGRV